MNSPKLWLTSHLVTHGVVSKLRTEMAVIRGDLFVTMPGAHASEKLEPDPLIAMPPTEAHSLNDYHDYYRAPAAVTKRPFFIQTSGGAKNVPPAVSLIEELAKEFPNFG